MVISFDNNMHILLGPFIPMSGKTFLRLVTVLVTYGRVIVELL